METSKDVPLYLRRALWASDLKMGAPGLTWTLPTMDTLGLMGALGLNVAALGRA
jgi:hypothetical protein